MKFSPTRAMIRRLSVANTVVMLFIGFPLYFLSPAELTHEEIVRVLLAQIPFLIFVFDASVVLWYGRKIERVSNIDILREAFVYGASWKVMQEFAAKTATLEKSVATMEQVMPELRNDREYAEAMTHRDFRKALSIAERTSQRHDAEEKKNRRKKERQALAQTERAKLEEEARKLFIPETILNSFQNPDLRHAIDLVKRSTKSDYSSLVLDSLKCGNSIAEAESMLTKAILLNERARALDAPQEIQTLIQSGAFDKAHAELNTYEQMQAREKIESALRTEIEVIDDPLFRDELLGELEALSTLAFNSREYRKQRHSIETTLQTCVE